MQAVFKVTLPPAAGEPKEKAFVPRRIHKKSRGGCLACKKRRIKATDLCFRLQIRDCLICLFANLRIVR